MIISRPETAEQFKGYYDLRWRILRAPWDQPRGSEKDEFEDTAEHVMAVSENREIFGCGRLHLNGSEEAQIRFMAVDPEMRGTGAGAAMLEELIRKGKAVGVERIVLNAREPVVGFYEKAGFEIVEEASMRFGVIREFRMRKLLVERSNRYNL